MGRGTFLRGRTPGGSKGSPVEVTSPTEIIKARLVLEPALAALAALRASLADIGCIEEAVEACVGAGDRAIFERADAAFHRRIAAAGRNRLLEGLLAALDAARSGELWAASRRARSRPSAACSDPASTQRLPAPSVTVTRDRRALPCDGT